MAMTTTLTLRYEGPPSCVDCQRDGVVLCDHIGFNPESWDYAIGQAVNAPGLDPAFTHTLRALDISPDRKTLTYTVETDRSPMLELARHLSILPGTPKAALRAIHHETGETLIEGHYFDAFLREGQQVCVNGVLHVVVGEPEHPNRHPEYGTCGGQPDLQVAKLMPTPVEPIQPVSGGIS